MTFGDKALDGFRSASGVSRMIHSGSGCIVQWFRRIADDGISEPVVNRQTVDHGDDIELHRKNHDECGDYRHPVRMLRETSLRRSMV